MTRPEHLDLAPIERVAGAVRLPGSKSISNRTLLLAALAHGETEVRGLLDSDDTARMLDALDALGVKVERQSGTSTVRVHGCGGRPPATSGDLFLGNAGTAFRPLTAMLALCEGNYRLSGVPRMHERPIADLVDALRPLGADITYLGVEGYPPLAIGPFRASGSDRVSVRGNVSSQFLTALLMALPLLGRSITIDVVGELISKPYIEITLNLLARFGVTINRDGWSRFHVPADARYTSPGVIHVEGDASSASYFLAAGAIGKGPVRVEGVGRQSIQGDVRFAATLEQMGAQVTYGDDWIEARGEGRLRAIDADLNHIPDAAMTVAILALFADGPSVIRNVASWRVKETDRLAAMATELRKLGATVEEGADYLRIVPPATLSAATIDTYDDHRMAMCFSLAAIGGVDVRIMDPMCVAKTFPTYFEVLGRLASPPPVIAIDGPSASGKGTVAALVADRLGYHYLDSGALYRLVALKARKSGVAWTDEPGVARLARSLDVRFEPGRVLLDGEDVSLAIRSEEAGSGASQVAVLPAVREALLDRQRAFRTTPGLVADGRDMASVVFPDATLKVFLTASAEARAQRRYKQLIDKGIPANLDGLLQELRERDRRDASRAVAPLLQVADAKLLDTTELTIDQAVKAVLGWYEGVRTDRTVLPPAE